MMNRLRKLGVYLNDEPGDREALAFTGLLAGIAQPESIYCMHVRGIENPVETPVPDQALIRCQIVQSLRREVADRIEIQVSEATGLQEVLRTALERDLDTLVVGRRLPHDQLGLGAAFYRLARKAPCDVLVVPAGTYAHLNRLLVLLDGSQHSRLALEAALHIAQMSGAAPHILVQSVYGISYGYHYAGMSLEEAARRSEELQRKRIGEFLANVDAGGVHFEVIYTCSQDIAAAAHDLASARNMDAIVIGSRGATLPAIALLGGTAERVLLNAPVPVLVIKRKGETFRFLGAVLAQFQEPG